MKAKSFRHAAPFDKKKPETQQVAIRLRDNCTEMREVSGDRITDIDQLQMNSNPQVSVLLATSLFRSQNSLVVMDPNPTSTIPS